MSRRRPTRPLIRYSLCPERYSLRLITTSPGFVTSTGASCCFFLRLNRLSGWPPSATAKVALPSAISAAASSERISLPSGACGACIASAALAPPTPSSVPAACSAVSLPATFWAFSKTNLAASASSGSSIVMVTSASPSGGRFTVPLKMQSAMRSARSDLWLCSPSTQEMASTTFDLPHPLGPTMHVVPAPLNVTTVRSQKDLNPTISTFRSLSKVSSFGLVLRLGYQLGPVDYLDNAKPFAAHHYLPKHVRCARPSTQRETRLYSLGGRVFLRQFDRRKVAAKNDWQVLD